MSPTAVPTLRRALALAPLLVLVACGPASSGPGDVVDSDGGEVVDADAGTPVDGGASIDAGTSDGGSATTPPTIRSLTPPRGQLSGGTLVVLSGRRFVEGFAAVGGLEASTQTRITFGDNAAVDINVIDDDTLEVKAPSGPRGAVDVTLTNPNGTATCRGCFTYFESIELTRVSPTQGTTRGGEPITLTGKGFIPGVTVLVGAEAATDVIVAADGLSLTAKTPPGVAGNMDVGVVGPNSAAFLRRSFIYVAPLSVERVSPPGVPLVGGVDVTITGEGFTSDADVLFGNVPASAVTVVSEKSIVARAPAAAVAGAVDVTVKNRRAQATLRGAFAYLDSSREVRLFAVSPRQGPAPGGTCAQGASTCLELAGSGFSGQGLSVRIGAQATAFSVVSDNLVRVDLPPGAPGVVDVQVRTLRGGALLPGAFAYLAPLSIDSISPAFADASGTPVASSTLTGAGFDGTCRVFVGPAEAAVTGVAADGTSLTFTIPSGSPGVRDVRVTCGAPGGVDERSTVLTGSFEYTAPLGLLQVDPETGAIAGNTLVAVYGAGFGPGMKVLFGRNEATQVEVKSPQVALVRSPKGSVGMVDVTVKSASGSEKTLPAAFGYIDPTNVNGGGSGGPMKGILNVTVLNSTPGMSGPVDGVTIVVNDDQLKGTTDARGQVTFSDPSLLKPVTITASKAKFATSSVARIDARNVTLFLQMNDGEAASGEGPPMPGPGTFQGRVCGFKPPPGVTLAPGQNFEARVYASAAYVYSAPPFRYPPTPVTVTNDCGAYSLSTFRYGALALYAEYGIADNSVSPATFTPILMGIRRGLESAPDRVVPGVDIVLDMHRDVSMPVRVLPAEAPAGQVAVNLVFSYLDLGGEGVVPLASTSSTQNDFVFEKHPRVSGEGLMFLNVAAIMDLTTGNANPPYSFYFRRQYGDLAAGVEIGPMLAFTQRVTPQDGGVFTGTLAWRYLDGQRPDVVQVSVEQPMGLFSKPIWDVVLPGTEQTVSLPTSALGGVPSGALMYWTITTARTPRFDFNRFGYQQLGVNAWTSFTQDFAAFTTP